MELTDGEITLRHPSEADAPAVAIAVQGSLAQLKPWMPWATDDFDEASALAWIRDETDPGSEAFLVVDADGEIVGSSGLHPLDERNERIELGYWTRADRAGRGVASRATRLLAQYAIEHRGARRVQIVMSVENEASRRVAVKAGAVHEGIARRFLLLHGRSHDAHVYSIIPSDLT